MYFKKKMQIETFHFDTFIEYEMVAKMDIQS